MIAAAAENSGRQEQKGERRRTEGSARLKKCQMSSQTGVDYLEIPQRAIIYWDRVRTVSVEQSRTANPIRTIAPAEFCTMLRPGRPHFTAENPPASRKD